MTFAAVTGTAGIAAARFAPPLARVPEQADSRSWLINSATRLTALREPMQEMRWEIPPGKCFIALLLYWQPREMGDSRILYLLRGESADASGLGLASLRRTCLR